MDSYVLKFAQIDPARIATVGGKGAHHAKHSKI